VADFTDDWELYHTKFGEVHCGTNVRRNPDLQFRRWWEKWGRAP
jgi:protein-arginine deiminase